MASGVDTYFSVIALFIIFRETIEASIIVSVLLQFLHRSFPQLKVQVWWGVGMGLLVSIIFGVIFVVVFYVTKNNAFSGVNQAIFKGSIAWFAGILITILAFAMLRYRGWEDKIKRKLEAMAEKELIKQQNGGIDPDYQPPTTWWGRTKEKLAKAACTAFAPCMSVGVIIYNGTNRAVGACIGATSRGTSRAWHGAVARVRGQDAAAAAAAADAEAAKKAQLVSDLEGVGTNGDLVLSTSQGWGIFIVVFATVVREGIESVVFLAGVGNAQPSSIPLPGLVGFICGVGVGVFLYYTGRQVKDIKYFIILMGVVLFFIAGGQCMLGAGFLITGGMFGYASPWVNDRPWYMQPLWDFSGCCADGDNNKFFALARAIFGYQDKPTFVEIMVYGGYWVIVLTAALYKWYTGSLFDADYKYKRQMAKEAKARAAAGERELSSISVGGAGSGELKAAVLAKQAALATEPSLAPAGPDARSSSSGRASTGSLTGSGTGQVLTVPAEATEPKAPQQQSTVR